MYKSAIHNWIYRADLRPTSGKNPDHVAVDETVIQFKDEQYRPYTPVDTATNELLYPVVKPTSNTMIAQILFAEISEKHDGSEAVLLVAGVQS